MGRPRGARSPAILIAIVCLAGASTAGEPIPHDLRVRVVVDPGAAAPERFADELRAVLIDDLTARGCYRSVRAADDDRRRPGELVFKVRVDEVDHRTEHAVGLNDRQQPRTPEDRRKYRIELDVSAEVGLLVPGSDRSVMSHPYRVHLVESPRDDWDDPKARLRQRLDRDFAKRVGRIACRPSAKQIGRWIAEHDDGTPAR